MGVILAEKGYVQYEGNVKKSGRFLPILLFSLECTLKKKLTIVALIIAWINALLKSVLFFVLTQGHLDPALIEAQGSRYFSETIVDVTSWMVFWTAFVLALVASNIISNDIKQGAYQVYFSKPITWYDYIFGKTLAVLFYIIIVLWIPILFLWLNTYLLSGKTDSPTWSKISGDITLENFAGSILFLIIITFVLCSLILMLSSLSKNSKFVAVLFFSFFLVGKALDQIVYFIPQFNGLRYLSIPQNLKSVGKFLLSLKTRSYFDVTISMAVLIFLFLISVYFLYKRVQIIIKGNLDN